MRMTKRTLAAFNLSIILVSFQTLADEGCSVGSSCAPCGYMAADVTATPAYANNSTPMVNYVATSEGCGYFPGYFSGFYVGAAYGGASVDYHLSLDDALMVSPSKKYQRGYLTTLADVGFNLVFNPFFIGAEVGYNYRARNHATSYDDNVDLFSVMNTTFPPGVLLTTQPGRIRVDINSQHAVTADLLPGFIYSRFTAYLRLGAEQSNYIWSRKVNFPHVDLNATTLPFVATISDAEFVETQNKKITGYRIGAGFGYAVSRHVSLHLNYIHTFCKKETITPNIADITANIPTVTSLVPFNPVSLGLSQLAADNVIRPQRNEVNLGIRFKL